MDYNFCGCAVSVGSPFVQTKAFAAIMVTNEIVIMAPIPTNIANSSGIDFAIKFVFRSFPTKYSASPTENGVKFIPLRAAKMTRKNLL